MELEEYESVRQSYELESKLEDALLVIQELMRSVAESKRDNGPEEAEEASMAAASAQKTALVAATPAIEGVKRALEFRTGGSSETGRRERESVADKLMRRDAEAQARLEAKREAAVRAEMAEVRAGPEINPRSRRLASGRDAPLAERAMAAKQARDARLEALRLEAERKETAEVRSGPSINVRSRKMIKERKESGVDRMMEWETKRQKRLEKARKAKEEAEKAELRPRVKVSEGSKRLLAKKQAKKQRNAATNTSRSSNSGSLDLDNVNEVGGERLYKMAKVYEDRARMRRETMEQAAAIRREGGPEAAVRKALAPPPVSAEPPGMRLYKEAEERRLRAAARVASQERTADIDDDGRPLFQPQLNPRSIAIASKKRHEEEEEEDQFSGEVRRESRPKTSTISSGGGGVERERIPPPKTSTISSGSGVEREHIPPPKTSTISSGGNVERESSSPEISPPPHRPPRLYSDAPPSPEEIRARAHAMRKMEERSGERNPHVIAPWLKSPSPTADAKTSAWMRQAAGDFLKDYKTYKSKK